MKSKLQSLKIETQRLCSEVATDLDSAQRNMGEIADDYNRVAELSSTPMVILNDIDSQFQKATKLSGPDIPILFVATAMQVIRQYLLTAFPSARLGDQEAANAVKSTKEHSNRKHRYYQPSLEEILTNPVPFDANIGASEYEALKGFGALGHRGATVGHDPVLGLIFGTANIATSTLTNWRMESYHIYSGMIGSAHGIRDVFTTKAQTPLVFAYTSDKLLHQGLDGKIIIGASLAKEIIHLKSDVYSKNSLPLPGISAISPVFAGELAKRGLDMANVLAVGKQATYSILINTLIAMFHGFFYDESSDFSRTTYEVRTRKILSYSNLIASASNVVVTACTRDLKLLDIGGLAVTLFRLVGDAKFIRDVKMDFLKNELYTQIVGSDYDFMKGDY